MKARILTLTLLALCLASVSSGAADAPKVKIASLKQLPTPLPYPYDENANAAAQVKAAFARAKQSGKRVLVDFGGNWCPDCRILAGVMDLPGVKPFVAAHYELVSVDVGRFDRNLDIVKSLGVEKLAGVPWLVVAAPDGATVASSDDITDDHHRTPQSMVDWLARYATKK